MNITAVVAVPVLTVSAMWPPADYVLTGLVLVLVLVGMVWGGLHSAGQQAAIWWENVRAVTLGRWYR